MTTPTRQSKRKASRRGEVRARLMYGAPEQGNSQCQWQTFCSKYDDKIFCQFVQPVFVLPADAESVERMAAQIRRAIIDNESDSPEIILAALGLSLTPTKP